MTLFTPARPLRAGLLVVAAVAAAAFLLVTPAVGAPPQVACDKRANNTYEKLLECVRVDGVREHQAALQAIADANGGTRAAATPGYDASVDYVVETIQAAGWTVELHRSTSRSREPIRATHADHRHVRDGWRHRQCAGDGDRPGGSCRHQPDPSAGEHERV